MRTRAAIIRETGKPWEVTTLELDQPGPGEVLIKFAASGLCHSDEHMRSGHTGFVLGGLMAGIAGVLFLGTTGRFNAIGTAVAVYFLATGVNGMQLLGAQNYVQQLFYGAALVIAVVLSRRLRRARA